jgi:hypothetical protein
MNQAPIGRRRTRNQRKQIAPALLRLALGHWVSARYFNGRHKGKRHSVIKIVRPRTDSQCVPKLLRTVRGHKSVRFEPMLQANDSVQILSIRCHIPLTEGVVFLLITEQPQSLLQPLHARKPKGRCSGIRVAKLLSKGSNRRTVTVRLSGCSGLRNGLARE